MLPDAHISIVAHITNAELQREIRDTAKMFNGFANRFLWCFSSRSKMLPRTVPMPDGYLNEEIHSLREALAFGSKQGLMRRDEAAEVLWEKAYQRLGSDPGGCWVAQPIGARRRWFGCRCCLPWSI